MSKAHKLHRLAMEKIYNKPLLIVQESLVPILDYLENRTSSVTSEQVEASLVEQGLSRSEKMLTDDLAVIPITGSLTYESNFLSALCGLTSYESLVNDVSEALDMGIKTIVFRADSGGGEAFAMMSSADMIRDMVDKSGGKIITYVDGMAASACYGLIAISDEVVMHPDSQAGSIGVVIQLMNNSEKLKKDGYKRKFITSADSKVPFDEEGEFKEDFLDELKEYVDEIHVKFVNHVAKYRPISAEQINGLKAKVFSAKKSLSLGLADKIMDHAEFQSYLENIVEDKQEQNMPLSFLTRKAKAQANVEQPTAALAAQQQEELEMADKALLAEMQAKLDALQATYDKEVVEAIAALDEKDAELNAALSELAAAKEALAQFEADKAQAALDAKKAKLEAAAGTEIANEVFPALSALDDAAFDKIVASYEVANKAFEKSPLAQEVGYEADGSAPLVQESALARRLRAQAAKQK